VKYRGKSKDRLLAAGGFIPKTGEKMILGRDNV